MIPSIGRIVHYRLMTQDVEDIQHARMGKPGNGVEAGQIYPAMIVRTWGNTEGSAVQLQVFLDGPDAHWATSRCQGDGNGQWFAPPRV